RPSCCARARVPRRSSGARWGSRAMADAKHTPHPARFDYVAWQYAPLRLMTAADERIDGVTVSLECGHTYEAAQHFSYSSSVGRALRPCGRCGKAIASELPEFKGYFDAAGAAIAK